MPAQASSTVTKWDDVTWLQATALAIAAALVAFGMILAIAANWDSIGRTGQFGLAGAALVAGCIAAIASIALRTPGLIMAFASTGGLLALLGQTFQTGADPWQLFAFWAAATLPFALASRSDALWMPWSLVAMTALQLWLRQTSGTNFFKPAAGMAVYQSWILAIGLILAMLPGSTGRSELGTSRWSFRFVLLLGLVAIAGDALPGLFDASIGRFFLGLLVCGGLASLVAFLRPVDLLALTMAVFALDGLLIGAITRMFMTSANGDIGSWLLIGFLSMGIVAASVKAILYIAQDDPNASALSTTLGNRDGSHWPIAVLSTFGAVFATIPLVVVLGLVFGKILFEGLGTYVGAAIILGAAGAALRSSNSGTFYRQFFVTILAIGIGMLGFALYRDLPLRAASLLLSAAAAGMAFAFTNRWISTVLGALATFLLLFAASGKIEQLGSPLGWSIVVAIWAIAVAGPLRPSTQSPSEPATTIHALLTGAIISALLSLSLLSGPSFMMSGYMGWSVQPVGAVQDFAIRADLYTIVSIAMALVAAALAITNITAMKSPPGVALSLGALVLSYLAPTLGPVLLIAAVSLVTGRHRLAYASSAAILWIVGGTYYALSMPLWMKGATLIAAGLVIAAATLLNGRKLPALPSATGPQSASRSAVAPLTLAGLATVATIVGTSFWQNASIIKTGQRAFLALAPVDPRSLMQGDYMTLRFALTTQAQPALATNNKEASQPVIAKLDPKGIATFDRLAQGSAPAGNGELLILVSKKSHGWIVGTDAFHFKEGSAARFQAAAFGDFRIAANGQAILVGLTDKDLKPLE